MVTRREFIGRTLGGAAAVAVPRALAGEIGDAGGDVRASLAAPPSPPGAEAECVLLDLGSGCVIRESFAGYESALTSLGVSWSRNTGELRHYPALIVVPAATWLSQAILVWLGMYAGGGSTVILELGSAFADDDSALEADRVALREIMWVRLDPPVSLWPRRSGGLPYVNHVWPSAASVRDFSRVLPMTAVNGDTIARVGDMPVAVRCRKDIGTTAVLGSPLGPALRSGDAEARRWLGEVVESARVRMAAYA